MSERVGIYGGMFDPVHDGHMAVARHALDLLQLDRLLLVPCHVPNHREPPVGSAAQRLAMLQLAIAGNDRMMIDPIEIHSEEVSYTARTLERIRERLPRTGLVLVLVLGMDAFLELPQWHDPERLFEIAHILVIAREKLPMDYHMAGRFGGSMISGPEQMFQSGHGRVLLTEDVCADVSSSAVRELLAHGLDAPLPEPVLKHVRDHGLYRATPS